MFYIVLIGLLTLALLVLLVFGLHRYQLSIAQTNADKHSPLPPLDQASLRQDLPDLSLDDEEPFTGTVRIDDDSTEFDDPGIDERASSGRSAGNQLPDKKTALKIGNVPKSADNDGEDDQEQDTAIAVPETISGKEGQRRVAVESSPPPAEKGKAKKNQKGAPASASNSLAAQTQVDETPDSAGEAWQDQVAELKKQDRLDEALALCTGAFPLWSAYQQASLIHRARIKQLNQAGKDFGRELKALYTLAARASFLHDRAKGLPNLSLAQLKALDLTPLDALEMPYDQIGYTELRLIKKTDIKLLLDLWGKPTTHTKPREFHADTWKGLCGDMQSRLF